MTNNLLSIADAIITIIGINMILKSIRLRKLLTAMHRAMRALEQK